MYVKITRNIVEAALEGNSIALSLLDDMDVACRYGKHLLWGELDVLKLLKDNYKTRCPALSRLYNSIATQGAIAEAMLWRIEFSLTEESSSVREIEGKYVICIAKNDIFTFQIFNECHVVAENLDDIQMYKHILDYYKRERKLSNTPNMAYPILGGGSTTAMVFNHEIDQRKSLVFCIVDSDKIRKGAQLKETALKVKEIYNEHKYKFHAFLYILQDVMEVENLVPMSIYEKYCTIGDIEQERGVVASHFAILSKIHDVNEEYLDFFDFKTGIRLCHLVDESKDNKTQEIIDCVSNKLMCDLIPLAQKYKNIISILENPELGLSPQKQQDFANKCLHQEAIVPGLGKEVLRNVLARCQPDFKTISHTQLSTTQKKVYNELGELLYNWTLAGEVMRI